MLLKNRFKISIESVIPVFYFLCMLVFISNSNAQNGEWEQQQYNAAGANIYGVHFVNESDGIGAGWGNYDVIWRSNDRGSTWSDDIGQTENKRNLAIDFVNESEGWIVGRIVEYGGTNDYFIRHTEDGGDTWSSVESGHGELWDVTFVNESKGWAVGEIRDTEEYIILHTNDGGDNWSYQDQGSGRLRSVSFVDENYGWAVGIDGFILHTNDGGNSWSSQSSGTNEFLLSVEFVNQSTGWAVGGSDGLILYTNDGGNSWSPQSSGTSETLRTVTFVNEKTGWTGGSDGTIRHTTDGGNTWVNQDLEGQRNAVHNIFFLNESLGWAVGTGEIVYRYEVPGPTSDFDADPDWGVAPLTVNFTDESLGEPDNWEWKFGDGNTSTEQNPDHTFSTHGEYVVCLTVTNQDGSDERCQTIKVYEDYPPNADFSATPMSGEPPLKVEFTDESDYEPDQWEWDFDDGNFSTNQNPVHTFNEVGEYEVCLVAKNDYGEDEICKSIEAEPRAPIAEFEFAPSSGKAPLQVEFEDQSKYEPEEWEWDFGDGNSSEERNPEHTFEKVGEFEVCLIVSNDDGNDENCKNVNVELPAPDAAFSANPSSGVVPLTVEFEDESAYDPEEWKWDFGDGVTSTEQNPEYTYDEIGDYEVCLEVTNEEGSDKKCKEVEVKPVPDPPVADFTVEPESGELPLEVHFEDKSENSPNEWYWDFGDGNTSSEQNPVHAYINDGIYSVSLSVANEGGEDEIVKEDLIAAGNAASIDLENKENNELIIYPNPSSGEFSLYLEREISISDLSLQIIDHSGKTIKKRNYQPNDLTFKENISLSSYPSGMYLIQINTGDDFMTKKLLIK